MIVDSYKDILGTNITLVCHHMCFPKTNCFKMYMFKFKTFVTRCNHSSHSKHIYPHSTNLKTNVSNMLKVKRLSHLG